MKTNREFAQTDAAFHAACARVKTGKLILDEETDQMVDPGIPPTKRQASKFRRKRGLAYNA